MLVRDEGSQEDGHPVWLSRASDRMLKCKIQKKKLVVVSPQAISLNCVLLLSLGVRETWGFLPKYTRYRAPYLQYTKEKIQSRWMPRNMFQFPQSLLYYHHHWSLGNSIQSQHGGRTSKISMSTTDDGLEPPLIGNTAAEIVRLETKPLIAEVRMWDSSNISSFVSRQSGANIGK